MPQVSANTIDIEYESFGSPSDPSVLLIMGLGMQMIAWPEPFCRELASQGFSGYSLRQSRHRILDEVRG